MYLNELNGFNGPREANNPVSDIEKEIQGQRGALPLPPFLEAVVVDYFFNPRKLSEEQLAELEANTNTPELIRRAPRNSILARIISRRQDFYDSTPRIFFPHDTFTQEPLKPGEHVVVYFLDQIQNEQIGYWFKRKTETNDTDDVNFTHADRKYEYNENLSTRDKFAGTAPPPPSFNNGGVDLDEESRTLADANAYKDISENATANALIVNEPVARFDKRPGDYAIQGSNASRAVFGMHRTGPATDEPRPRSAAFDLVAGYGREGTPTAPKTIENARGQQETNKAPEKSKEQDNPREGDPDFENDPVRIYGCESFDVDQDFGINVAGVTLPEGEAACIVSKSDRQRVEARENIVLRAGETAFVMDAEGNVRFVAGARVDLGSANSPLGVARLNDSVLLDSTTDPQLFQFLSAVGVYVAALANALSAVGAPPPPPALNQIPVTAQGKIAAASTKVFAD
jgi:hypothetical protein